jgi:hypothetical protein
MRDHEQADASGSTAQFRAFVDHAGGAEAAQPWSMGAPRNRVAKFAAIVVGVAVVLAVLALLVLH